MVICQSILPLFTEYSWFHVNICLSFYVLFILSNFVKKTKMAAITMVTERN
jgi:hypothetical protein